MPDMVAQELSALRFNLLVQSEISDTRCLLEKFSYAVGEVPVATEFGVEMIKVTTYLS
jgi:hypothetical protein